MLAELVGEVRLLFQFLTRRRQLNLARSLDKEIKTEFSLFSEEPPLQLIGYLPHQMQYRSSASLFALRELLKVVCKPSAMAVDIGTGRGYSASVLAALAKHGKVYAFESDPNEFGFLQYNIGLNRLRNTRPIQGRIGIKGIVPHESKNAGVTELDHWARRRFLHRVDLLHLHEPGREWQILQGARRIVSESRPVVVIHYDALRARKSPQDYSEQLFLFLKTHYSHLSVLVDEGTQISVASIGDYRDWLGLLRDGSGQETLICATYPLKARTSSLSAYQDRLRRRFGRELVLHPRYQVNWLKHSGRLQSRGISQLQLQLTNRGAEVWSAQGQQPVRIACRWRNKDGERVTLMPLFSSLPRDIAPGEVVEVLVAVQLPAEDGAYECVVSLFQEGIGWFDEYQPDESQSMTMQVTNSFASMLQEFPPR